MLSPGVCVYALKIVYKASRFQWIEKPLMLSGLRKFR